MPASRHNPCTALAPAVTLVAASTQPDGRLDTFTGWLDSPTVAFVLLAVGIMSTLIEVANPGIVGTGVGGVTAIGLGLWSLSMQPVTPIGLGLVVVAAALYVTELFVPATGIAAGAGSVAMLTGGLLLVDGPAGGVPLAAAVPVSGFLGGAIVVAGRVARRTRQTPAQTGTGLFIGRDVTVARTGADGITGDAFIEGAWWQVRSTGPVLVPGMPARVVDVDRLVLVVDPGPPLDDLRQKEHP